MTESVAKLHRRRFDVMADGRRLRVERLEPERSAPEAPHLVFLHEGLGSIDQWKRFPAALCAATGLPGLIYERWGFGGSEPLSLPRPRDYLNQEAERALPEVLEACAITRPILIGHSDGGTIALLFAAAFPERPLACITEAAHVSVEEAALAGIRAAITAWRTTDLKARLAKYHGTQSETLFRGWAETWTHPDFRDWSMVAALPAIVCPLLVIQGLDDQYGTPAQVETIVRQSGGPAEPLLIPGCGHVPHHEAQSLALQAMSGFVDRIAAGQT